MTTEAPTISVNRRGRAYPDKGTRLALAWDMAWDRIRRSGTEYVDGSALAVAVHEATGVHPDTTKNLLNSARNVGLLEHTYRKVEIPGRGPRTRTHYRAAGAA